MCSDVAMHSANACQGGLILCGLTSGLHTLNPNEATMATGAATLWCNYAVLFWLVEGLPKTKQDSFPSGKAGLSKTSPNPKL